MNANELAVELERYLKGEEYDRLVWEIPDFLRQQQAEIESLLKFINERGETGQLIIWKAQEK